MLVGTFALFGWVGFAFTGISEMVALRAGFIVQGKYHQKVLGESAVGLVKGTAIEDLESSDGITIIELRD